MHLRPLQSSGASEVLGTLNIVISNADMAAASELGELSYEEKYRPIKIQLLIISWYLSCEPKSQEARFQKGNKTSKSSAGL